MSGLRRFAPGPSRPAPSEGILISLAFFAEDFFIGFFETMVMPLRCGLPLSASGLAAVFDCGATFFDVVFEVVFDVVFVVVFEAVLAAVFFAVVFFAAAGVLVAAFFATVFFAGAFFALDAGFLVVFLAADFFAVVFAVFFDAAFEVFFLLADTFFATRHALPTARPTRSETDRRVEPGGKVRSGNPGRQRRSPRRVTRVAHLRPMLAAACSLGTRPSCGIGRIAAARAPAGPADPTLEAA